MEENVNYEHKDYFYDGNYIPEENILEDNMDEETYYANLEKEYNTESEPPAAPVNPKRQKTGKEYYDMCKAFDNLDPYTYRSHNKASKYIIELLDSWYKTTDGTKMTVPNSTGTADHIIVKFPIKKKPDLRRIIPKSFIELIYNKYDAKYINNNSFLKRIFYNEADNSLIIKEVKITITWLVCYVNGKNIDNYIITNPNEWEYYQCSHRCAEMGLKDYDTKYGGKWRCIDPKCLYWEDASTNQSRGNSMCRLKCQHKDCNSGMHYCLCNDGFIKPDGSRIHDPPCW